MMERNLDCRIVRDLLPSYMDGLTCEYTTEAVRRHVETCPACAEVLKRMEEPARTEATVIKEVDYLKKVRSRMNRWKTAFGTVAVLLVLVIAAGLLIYGRVVPRSFSQVFGEEQVFSGVTVTDSWSASERSLEPEDVKTFVALLEDAAYYYEGRNEGIMYGSTYIVSLKDGQGRQAYSFWLSDEYRLYYADRIYDLRQDKELVDLVVSLFDPEGV